VAVKRIPIGAHQAAAARAEREALAAARLSHPAVVALYEAGRDEDAVYLVSELVRGPTLRELLEEEALSDRDVVEIGLALCDALTHAHARGIVHRDVKPGNILVPESAREGVAAKLTDFGIARMAGDDALTATGDVVGTLAYMAPEQAEGRGVTAASDLYSLGLVLYECFAGVNPVRADNAAATARRVGTRLPPLRRLRRDLPRGLGAAIDAAVLPDPALRGSVDGLRAALRSAEVSDEPEWAARRARPPRAPTEPEGRDTHAQAQAWRWGARVRVGLPARLVGAALTAGLVALVLALPGGPQVDPLSAAAASAAAVALLPRLGWIAVAILGVATAGGSAVALLAAAAFAVPPLAPRSPAWWSAPGIAVGLGFAGAPAAFATVAGQARDPLTRAAVGALGAWWLVAAEALTGRRLLTGGVGETLGEAVRSGALAIAPVWAVAAAVLPWVVRGRNAALDLVGACAWAAAVALATRAVAPAEPRGLLAGAALGALGAVLASALRPRA
jgi:hypothetical protein